MRRRQFVLVALAGMSVALTGCARVRSDLQTRFDGTTATSTGGVAREPADDEPPRSVLPSPPPHLDITGFRRAGQTVGANAGQLATYEAGDGTQYELGALRMETLEAAQRLAARIADQGRFYGFDILVRHGVYLIGGGTEDGSRSRLVALLVRSDALSRAFLAEHDLFSAR
ncbi:hypothetical protein [Haloarchaeobius sp. TZWWS8]|uniref:hypothetical protein n=1 Tax=Haloarchaeobius sp. TZWWS8 TaxID=3446121 RepID=UPI003EC1237C